MVKDFLEYFYGYCNKDTKFKQNIKIFPSVFVTILNEKKPSLKIRSDLPVTHSNKYYTR